MTILIPLLVAVIAALLYCVMANPKGVELARLSFGAAMLVLLWVLSQASLKVLLSK